jgi:hypothetical protein
LGLFEHAIPQGNNREGNPISARQASARDDELCCQQDPEARFPGALRLLLAAATASKEKIPETYLYLLPKSNQGYTLIPVRHGNASGTAAEKRVYGGSYHVARGLLIFRRMRFLKGGKRSGKRWPSWSTVFGKADVPSDI